MNEEHELLPEVEAVPPGELEEYIRRRAGTIVGRTQGDCWSDPEDWQMDAIELAHAVTRYFREVLRR